jgi:hypothetical protein
VLPDVVIFIAAAGEEREISEAGDVTVPPTDLRMRRK